MENSFIYRNNNKSNKTVENYIYTTYELTNYMRKNVNINVYAVPEEEEDIIDFNIYGQFLITTDGYIYLYSRKEFEAKKLIDVLPLCKQLQLKE